MSKHDLSVEGKPCILYGQLYTTYNREVIHKVLSKTNNRDENLFYGKSNDVIIPASGETAEDISTACCVIEDNIIFGGDLNVIRTNHDGCFLSYQLNGVRKYDVAKLAVGKSVVHLHNDQIKNLKCYFPNRVEEEKKVVKLLDYLDTRIETQNKIIEDYILLRKKLNNQFFDSLINKIKFKSIYKIASEGGTPDTSKANYYNGGQIPFVKIENLYDKYLVSCNNYITQDGLKNSSAWLVPKNSILLSNGATIGETAINKIDVATKQGILGIIPSDDYDVEFLYYLFKSNRFVRTLKRITTKGTMDAAYLKDLNQENIYVCSKEDWKKHIYLMSLMDLLIDNDHKILSKYKMQKNFLLNNLFI